jgi:hypothetical protein
MAYRPRQTGKQLITWQGFLAGAICGTFIVGLISFIFLRQQTPPPTETGAPHSYNFKSTDEALFMIREAADYLDEKMKQVPGSKGI